MVKLPFSFSAKSKDVFGGVKEFLTPSRRPRREENSMIYHSGMQTWLLPPHPITYTDMINLSDMQSTVRSCKKHVKWETLRRGLEWAPLWSARCKECGDEFQEISHNLPCPKCSGEMEGPDPSEYKRSNEFVKTCNMNNQDLIQIIEALEDDQNSCDEGYLIIRKKYLYDENGYINNGKVEELIRGSPTVMRPVANPTNGAPGWSMFVCPEHRDKVFQSDLGGEEYTDMHNYTPRCHCGRPMYPVFYVSLQMEGAQPQQYYIEGEVLNAHKYGSGLLFGTPPMITLWTQVAALFYQETYIKDYYQERRTPLGAVVVNTSNAPVFLKFWKKVMEEMKRDKFFVPFIPLETEPGATQQGRINWVSFMDKLRDMDYVPTREEFRRSIAAFYGVSMIFLNDMFQAGSGTLNEGTTQVVSSRTTEKTQDFYNRKYLAPLSQMLGVKNYVLKIKATEERDELKRLQQEQLQMQLNQLYTTIGYKSEQDPYTGEWYHKKDPVQELNNIVQFMQTLVGVAHPETQMQPMDDGGSGKGGKDKKMQTYEPNSKATSKGEEEDTLLNKSKLEGTPQQGTTSVSTPRSIQVDPKPSGPTPASARAKDAPGGAGGSYACKICGKNFPSKEALGGHMRRDHKGGGGSPSGGEGGMGMIEPDMAVNALDVMRNSKMFDNNVMDILEEILSTVTSSTQTDSGDEGGKEV